MTAPTWPGRGRSVDIAALMSGMAPIVVVIDGRDVIKQSRVKCSSKAFTYSYFQVRFVLWQDGARSSSADVYH